MRESTRRPTGASKVILYAITAVIVVAIGGGVAWAVATINAPRHVVASTLHDLQDLCGGRAIPEAPAYVPGSGTHPIAVFENDRDNTGGSGISAGISGAKVDLKLFNPTDARSVQLVACTERTADGPPVSTCTFKQTSGPMHRSTLEITIYEARTGKPVREPITVVGEKTDCPFLVTYRGKEPVMFSAPSEKQFVAVLSPFTQS